MSWFKDTVKKLAPYVAPAVMIFAPELLPVIGTSLGASASAASAVGAAAVAGGSTALAGGKPEDVAKSALGSYIAGDVTQSATPDLGKAAATGLGQTAGSILTGGDPQTAVKQGLIAGTVQGAFGTPAADASALDKTLNVGEKYLASKALGSELFKPSPIKSSQTVGSGTATPATSVATTGAGQSPGSQALGQALRTGDMGATIFGGEKDKGKQSGWNVESLRYMGQET